MQLDLQPMKLNKSKSSDNQDPRPKKNKNKINIIKINFSSKECYVNNNGNFYVQKQHINLITKEKNPTLLKHHILTMHKLYKTNYYVNHYTKLDLEENFTRQTNSKYLKTQAELGVIDLDRSSCFKVKHTENFPKTGKEWASVKNGFTQFTAMQMQYIYEMDVYSSSLYINLQLAHEANFSKPFVTTLYSLETKTGICRKTILKKLKILNEKHLISLGKIWTNDTYEVQKYEILFRKFDPHVNEIPSEHIEDMCQDVNEIPNKCYPDSTMVLTGFHHHVNEIPTIKELVPNYSSNELVNNNRSMPTDEKVEEKPKQKPQSKVSLVWKSYVDAIEKKYNVKPTVTNMAIINANLKRLLSLEWVKDHNHLIELIKFYLETDDKFYSNQLHPIYLFIKQAGEINTKYQFTTNNNGPNPQQKAEFMERKIRTLWNSWGIDQQRDHLAKYPDICKKLGVA